MSLSLITDDDVRRVRDAFSQVIKDAIGQTATVLVPAIATALGSAIGEIKITCGPITLEPFEIDISIGERKP